VTTLFQASAPLGRHGWHLVEGIATLVFTLGGIWLAEFVQGRQRRGPAPSGLCEKPARTRNLRRTLLPLVVITCCGAAAIHFAVMPEHFEESVLYGTFFLVIAIVQLAYAGLLMFRPSRSLLLAGALGNAAVILLWLFTRTVTIPLGPGAGTTEEFGGLDVLSSAFEFITFLGAIALLRKGRAGEAAPPKTWSPPAWIAGLGAGIAVLLMVKLAPAS
jgi:hypothetical protein